MKLLPFAGCALLFPCAFAQQQRAAYDVVSIHPIELPQGGMSLQTTGGDGFRERGWKIRGIIATAYGLPAQRILNLPQWVDATQYEISARMDATYARLPYDSQLYRQRLQSLLEDRFHLHAHIEQRLLRVYALEYARSGSRLTPSTTLSSSATMQRGHLSFSGATVASLARELGNVLSQEVLERTGDTRRYDIDLDWSDATDSLGDSDYPELPKALEEQCGLNLAPQKALLDVLIIDAIAPPTSN